MFPIVVAMAIILGVIVVEVLATAMHWSAGLAFMLDLLWSSGVVSVAMAWR